MPREYLVFVKLIYELITFTFTFTPLIRPRNVVVKDVV
jgi:hypothetical protein